MFFEIVMTQAGGMEKFGRATILARGWASLSFQPPLNFLLLHHP
jgi:hypothetical protein